MAIFVPFLQKAETSSSDQAFSSKTEKMKLFKIVSNL